MTMANTFLLEEIQIKLVDQDTEASTLSLIETMFSLKSTNHSFLNSMDQNQRSFIAVLKNLVVGHVLITTLMDPVKKVSFYRLDYICVATDYQKRGIGTKLLEFVEELAGQEKITWIEFTSAYYRKEAHSFYLINDYQIRDTATFRKVIK